MRARPLCRFLNAIALLSAPAPALAQQIRARAVDEPSRQAVRDATALLLASERVVATATTGRDGYFRLHAPGPGTFRVVVRQPGFAEAARELTLSARDTTLAAFVLAAEAIALDSIAVQTRRRRMDPFAAGFVRPSYLIAGDRILRLEDLGGTVYTGAREISGLRMREFRTPGGRRVTCVESVRRATTFGEQSPGARDCPRHVVVVLDGMVVPGPEDLLRTIQLEHLESMTYLPPTEAGFRYGTAPSIFGALVLWSRGRGPFVSEERNRR